MPSGAYALGIIAETSREPYEEAPPSPLQLQILRSFTEAHLHHQISSRPIPPNHLLDQRHVPLNTIIPGEDAHTRGHYKSAQAFHDAMYACTTSALKIETLRL